MESRNLFVRIIAGAGWLILIYFASNMLIGMIVGVIAGASTETYEAGKVAGEQASLAFFQKYGLIVLACQLAAFAGLAFTGKLPGTTKYRNAQDS